MSLFGKFDLESMIEKAMEHIDMEEIASEVMKDLKITDFEMYFVVYQPDRLADSDYEFLGMAYSIESARKIRDEAGYMNEVVHLHGEILKLNLAKLVPLAKKMNFVETVR